jgi:hypothetical protein
MDLLSTGEGPANVLPPSYIVPTSAREIAEGIDFPLKHK